VVVVAAFAHIYPNGKPTVNQFRGRRLGMGPSSFAMLSGWRACFIPTFNGDRLWDGLDGYLVETEILTK